MDNIMTPVYTMIHLRTKWKLWAVRHLQILDNRQTTLFCRGQSVWKITFPLLLCGGFTSPEPTLPTKDPPTEGPFGQQKQTLHYRSSFQTSVHVPNSSIIFPKVELDRLPSKKMIERWLIPWWFMMIPWWFQFSAHSTEFPWTQISQRLRSIFFQSNRGSQDNINKQKINRTPLILPHPPSTQDRFDHFDHFVSLISIRGTHHNETIHRHIGPVRQDTGLGSSSQKCPPRLEVVGKMKHFRFSIDEIFYVGFRGKKTQCHYHISFQTEFSIGPKGEKNTA